MICACGCGAATSLIKYNDRANGLVAGTYRKYRKGHFSKGVIPSLQSRIDKYAVRAPNGCLEWTGLLNKGGYGKSTFNHQTKIVHRLVWEAANGPIPLGIWVLHECDNRRCIELSHLFLGTPQDNTDDMISKKRHSHGEITKTAKLTQQQVVEIKRRLGSCSQTQLAREFSISNTQMSRIATNQSWAHVVVPKRKINLRSLAAKA